MISVTKRIELPPKPILFIIVILFILFPMLEYILYVIDKQPTPFSLWDYLFWGLLISWAQITRVRLPFFASFSHIFIFLLAAIILFPLWVPPLLAALFFFNRSSANTYTWYKDIFNRLQTAITVAGAALVYWAVITYVPVEIAGSNASQAIALAAASAVSFVINITLVSLVVHFSTGLPIRDIWFHNYGWVLASYLIMSPVVLLLARMYTSTPPLLGNWGGWSVILFLIPLYYARFHWDEVVKLREAFNKTVDLLSNTIDAKDSHTFLHSERVTAIASALARAYGLDAAQINTIEKGSRIHDIGKIGIPDAVLFKPGSLTEEEYNIIKKHPEYGVRLLEPASDYLSETFDIIKYHHERWDGRGYPEGLAGQEIPLWARIVGLADAYEAMTAGRPYQKAKTPEDALREIEDLAGIQFDPKLVRLFREIWETNPAWRDREVFLRLYSSKVPSLESSSPPSLEREPETSQKSS
ncbi:HD-GYP domain-containing protein [Oceanithermus sp.]|uniref:HD-GYP domain-containing protein n=1 Tax=Oceanithermus sp. TaxID=2268145 RepID=UPI00338D80EB